MRVDVIRRKLLKRCGQNDMLGFPWWRECNELPLIEYFESVSNSESRSGRQQEVSTEAMVGGTGLYREENEEEEDLCLFGNNISADMYYAFLYYRTRSDNDNIVEGKMMQLARNDDLVTTVLTSLEKRGRGGAHRHNVHADTLISHVSEVANQLIEQVHIFLRS